MGRFLNGVLIGVGIGLLVAPMKGEEMRRMVSEHYSELRNNLPDNEQLKQAGQQVASSVSQATSKVQDYAQQAASQVKAAGSNVGDRAQQATREVKNSAQGIASTTKQTATSMKQNATSTYQEPENEIIFVDDMALDEGQ